MLENIEGEFPSQVSEAQAYKTQLIRRELRKNGVTIFAPKANSANWTVVLSKGRSITEDIVDDNFTFSMYERPRFLEVISVPDAVKAIDLIQHLPSRKCYKDVERVQTVGYAMHEQQAYDFARKLSDIGVYRIVPLDKMFMRSMLEPSDGEYLPRQFTFFSYMSK
jgi:hypothetical protein